jgi:hypothetical protein
MVLTASQRSQRARVAATSMHAQGKTNTRPAREAWFAKFEDQVDPDKTLEPAERERRAQLAVTAYMRALALKSSRSRTRKG